MSPKKIAVQLEISYHLKLDMRNHSSERRERTFFLFRPAGSFLRPARNEHLSQRVFASARMASPSGRPLTARRAGTACSPRTGSARAFFCFAIDSFREVTEILKVSTTTMRHTICEARNDFNPWFWLSASHCRSTCPVLPLRCWFYSQSGRCLGLVRFHAFVDMVGSPCIAVNVRQQLVTGRKKNGMSGRGVWSMWKVIRLEKVDQTAHFAEW